MGKGEGGRGRAGGGRYTSPAGWAVKRKMLL